MKIRIRSCLTHLDGGKTPAVTFTVSGTDYDRLQELAGKNVNGYEIEIKKPKRTDRANRYMWELINEIADRAELDPNTVYRRAIMEAGHTTPMTISEAAFETFRNGWESRGTGWMVQADPAWNGQRDCVLYYGSSTYDKAEMSKLIDYVVEEAQFWGIETETPEQIERMKMAWREA